MVLEVVAEDVGQLLFEGVVNIECLVGDVSLALVLLGIIVGVLGTVLADVQGHVEVGFGAGARNAAGSIEVRGFFLAVGHVFVCLLFIVVVGFDLVFGHSVENQVGRSIWVGDVL